MEEAQSSNGFQSTRSLVP